MGFIGGNSFTPDDVTLSNTAGGLGQIKDGGVTSAKMGIGSPAQGDILYYNGTAWVLLTAGTSGHFLKTLGAGANPLWAANSFAGLRLVESKVFAADAQTFDFATTLAGDTEKGYILVGRIVNNGTQGTYTLRMNGGSCAGTYSEFRCFNTSLSTSRASGSIVGSITAAETGYFYLVIPAAQAGYARGYLQLCTGRSGANLERKEYCGDITTPSTATEITSIGISCDVANGLGTGSELRIFAFV